MNYSPAIFAVDIFRIQATPQDTTRDTGGRKTVPNRLQNKEYRRKAKENTTRHPDRHTISNSPAPNHYHPSQLGPNPNREHNKSNKSVKAEPESRGSENQHASKQKVSTDSKSRPSFPFQSESSQDVRPPKLSPNPQRMENRALAPSQKVCTEEPRKPTKTQAPDCTPRKMVKPVFLAQRRRKNIKSQKDEMSRIKTPSRKSMPQETRQAQRKVNVQSRSKKYGETRCQDKGERRAMSYSSPTPRPAHPVRSSSPRRHRCCSSQDQRWRTSPSGLTHWWSQSQLDWRQQTWNALLQRQRLHWE